MADQRSAQRTGSGSLASVQLLAWAGAVAALAASTGFDLLSYRSGKQYVEAERGWQFLGVAAAVAVVAVLLQIAKIVRLERTSPERRPALIGLAVLDVTLLWSGIGFVSRRSSSLVPTDQWAIVVSGLVALASLVGLALEVRRTLASRSTPTD